jgi:hypothetical protein
MKLYSIVYFQFSQIAERISREYYKDREETDATQYEYGKYYKVYPIELDRFLTDLTNIPLFTKYLLCLRHSFEIINSKDIKYDPNLVAQYTNTFLFYLDKLNGYLNNTIRPTDKRDINTILKEYAEKANYEDVLSLFPKLDPIEKYRLSEKADEADKFELRIE